MRTIKNVLTCSDRTSGSSVNVGGGWVVVVVCCLTLKQVLAQLELELLRPCQLNNNYTPYLRILKLHFNTKVNEQTMLFFYIQAFLLPEDKVTEVFFLFFVGQSFNSVYISVRQPDDVCLGVLPWSCFYLLKKIVARFIFQRRS